MIDMMETSAWKLMELRELLEGEFEFSLVEEEWKDLRFDSTDGTSFWLNHRDDDGVDAEGKFPDGVLSKLCDIGFVKVPRTEVYYLP